MKTKKRIVALLGATVCAVSLSMAMGVTASAIDTDLPVGDSRYPTGSPIPISPVGDSWRPPGSYNRYPPASPLPASPIVCLGNDATLVNGAFSAPFSSPNGDDVVIIV